MMHRFTMPTDAELETQIARVFESMPSADQAKLSMIESRLLQKARRDKSQKTLDKIPWWIVILLAGGFATAAWWAGDMYFDRQSSEITDKQVIPSDNINKRQSGVDNAEPGTESNTQ